MHLILYVSFFLALVKKYNVIMLRIRLVITSIFLSSASRAAFLLSSQAAMEEMCL